MKNHIFETAERILLAPGDIKHDTLNKIFNRISLHKIDYSDIFFQAKRSESWTLEDGIVKEGNYNIDQGAGIRAISGEKTGFSYTDEIRLTNLIQAADTARTIARVGQSLSTKISTITKSRQQLYPLINPLESLSCERKVDLLHEVEREARRQDPRVKRVIVSLSAVYDVILVATIDGTLSADIRPLVRMNVHVIVEQKGRREQGNAGAGQRTSLKFFIWEERGLKLAREAVRQALINLDAVEAPAGNMPVVLGAGWPGVLLHEAVGHGLEGDFNRKGTSAFSNRIGERVASSVCTIVDNGTIEQLRGSLSIDDEGTPTQCTMLIENGILKRYLQDKHNARLMRSISTGNGRRESYAHLPIPRMTNTYMLNGKYDPNEIIASVQEGIYALNFGGGQVDITSGKFVFSTSEAYLIKNGRVQAPVKGVTLIGNGPDILTQVSMVGNNMELDSGVGICGKEGQNIPVGVGQPTLKVEKLTVGGTV